MRCEPASRVSSLAHVELFAANHVVVIPAGIGFAPPLRRRGAYVHGGACVYPMRTIEPTGLVLLAAERTRNLGDLFDLWGQPLSDHDVAGFRTSSGHHVSVFLNGSLWRGSPNAAPIAPHAQITIEVGRYVPPHARYAFPSLQCVSRASSCSSSGGA
jgi:hypothetical protein